MSLVFNMVGGGGGGIKLTGIAITKAPTKTTYTQGETFDPAGMVVTATYSNGATLACTGYSYEPNTPLADGTTKVIIRYTEGGVTKTAEQAITVVHRLTKIEITAQPTKTAYEYGDSFQSAGMVVKATYSDGASANVTGYSCSPATLNPVGTQTITVSYTERSVTKTATTSVTVNRKTISTVPSQSGTLTYTGSAQSPQWSNYDSNKLTIGGTNTATNAGSYAATFAPKDNYQWSDGSTSAKSVTWAIGKAAGSLTLAKSSVTLNISSLTESVAVTRAGDGVISATSSNTATARVEVSGTSVKITGLKAGTAKITVKVAAGTNHTAPSDKTINVTISLPDTSLANNTPDIIAAAAKSGQAANYWSVGDKVGIAVNGSFGGLSYNNTVYAFILGFNHNSSVEGGNSIHFQFGKTAAGVDIAFVNSYGSTSTGFCMNTSNTNSGGWNNSYMRKTICPAFLAALPTAWQNIIAACTKYSDNTGGGSNTASYVTATSDKIWPLSEMEVQGTRSYANSAEANYQKQYDYYKNGNSKVKYQHTATTTACLWWLRSVRASGTSHFCIVYTDGSANSSAAYISYGFAPGFKVA